MTQPQSLVSKRSVFMNGKLIMSETLVPSDSIPSEFKKHFKEPGKPKVAPKKVAPKGNEPLKQVRE